MPPTQTQAPRETASRNPSVSTRARTLAYLAVLVLVPVLPVPLAILLGRSDFFLQHGASVWVRANDSIFTMHGRTCDVLLFGDSTAMTGLDPDLIARQTGLPTCNIAVTNSVLAVTDMLVLDRFLARNSRPRFLVLQLSPETFAMRRQPWERTAYPEGLLELLRWGSPAAARSTLLAHPQEALAFAGYSAGFTVFSLAKRAWERVTRTRSTEDRIVLRNGFFTPPGAALTACPSSDIPPPQPGDRAAAHALVDDLRQRYRPAAGHVVIQIAPIPACDPNLSAQQGELRGLADDALEALPITLFNDERHYTAAGSALLSLRVAAAIAPATRGTSGATTSDAAPPRMALSRSAQ